MAHTTLNELAAECHQVAVDHGFWADSNDNRSVWPEKIALIHSEASEMLECLRKGKGEEALSLECADLLIRLLDFTDARGIDMDQAVLYKMAVNKERDYLHGGNF